MHCYICDKDHQNTVTKYPDGKDPCPECVDSYRSFKSTEDTQIVFDEEDTEKMDQLELFNLPAGVEDYYEA